MRDLVRRWSLIDTSADARAGALLDRAADRIDEVDGEIRAFVDEPGRRARLRGAARSVRTAWPAPADGPPLAGIPVGVKDIIRVDGLPTRAGSTVPAEVLRGAQAAVVDRLLGAGAVVAGKTETAEFAASAPGPTRNPHHLGHTPGGSSSGSAAAVAAGMVPLAVGTQTIGSVIRPAAYCGIVGFVPSHGRIPVAGVIPNAPSLDRVGVFAADVPSAAIGAAVLLDRWHPPTGTTLRSPVLGIPTGDYLSRSTEPARALFEEQVATLAAAGFAVTRVGLPGFAAAVEVLRVINRYEFARAHRAWFARHAGCYRAETTTAVREGQAVPRADYQRALDDQQTWRDAVATLASRAGIDVWVSPAATGAAPAGLESTGDPVMCLPWSLAGLPAVTVASSPIATASPAAIGRPEREGSRLPGGLQCVGGPGSDEQLLIWTVAIEAALRAGP